MSRRNSSNSWKKQNSSENLYRLVSSFRSQPVMVKFMNNNVAGIHVPDEMIEELKADKEKTKAGITGVEIAARIIKECKPYCQGVHIMALGWESKIPDLLKLAEI